MVKFKIILLITITVFFCCSCDSVKEITPTKNEVQKEMQIDEKWKYDVAQRLYYEFCQYYDNIGNDDFLNMYDKNNRVKYNSENSRTAYSRIMAADRATALLGVYSKYLNEEQLSNVQNKKESINNEFFADSQIYFGYTNSGLHILAVCKGVTNNNLMYYETRNKIRGIENESEFFEEMYFAEGICHMCDVYVEDLSGMRQVIVDIDLSFYLYNGDEKPIKANEKVIFSDEELDIMQTYNKSINTDNTYNNKSWNLLACDNNFDIIEVTVDEETVSLSCNIP